MPSDPNARFLSSSSVIRPIVSESISAYSDKCVYTITFSAPNELQWIAANLYKSYNSESGYVCVERTFVTGVTGIVSSIGFINNIAYLDVILDSNYILQSALDLD